MVIVFGVETESGHIDTSNTLLGAKQYATRHSYTIVTKRTGYNALRVAEKIRGKWVKLNLYKKEN